MAKLKVNKELWSNISEKKKKNIASNLKVKIVPNSDASLPDPKDVVYGMTIREAAMLLAKKDKSELLARLKQDLKTEKILKKFFKKRPNELPYLTDILSRKYKKEKKYKKALHLTKDEALLARKIEKKLIKNTGHVNAKSMLYSVRVRDITYRTMYYQKSGRSRVECYWLCCQYYDEWWDIVDCIARCQSNIY